MENLFNPWCEFSVIGFFDRLAIDLSSNNPRQNCRYSFHLLMEDIFRRPPEGSIPKRGKTGGEAIPAGEQRNAILDRIFRISTGPRFGWGGNKQDPVRRGHTPKGDRGKKRFVCYPAWGKKEPSCKSRVRAFPGL